MLVGSVTWGLGTSTSSSWELTDFSPTCTEFESELPLALHCLQGIGKSAFGVEFRSLRDRTGTSLLATLAADEAVADCLGSVLGGNRFVRENSRCSSQILKIESSGAVSTGLS